MRKRLNIILRYNSLNRIYMTAIGINNSLSWATERREERNISRVLSRRASRVDSVRMSNTIFFSHLTFILSLSLSLSSIHLLVFFFFVFTLTLLLSFKISYHISFHISYSAYKRSARWIFYKLLVSTPTCSQHSMAFNCFKSSGYFIASRLKI